MINGIRTYHGVGKVDNVSAGWPNETDYVMQRARVKPGEEVLPPLVFVHGAGALTDAHFEDFPLTVKLWFELAKYFTVIVTDMGGSLWGSFAHQGYIERARLYLNNTMGCSGPVTLVGVSMGGGAIMAYARNGAYASNVRAVAGIVPLTSLNSLKNLNPAFQVSIDAAYSGAGGYTDATSGANHSPVIFGNHANWANTPTKLFYSSNDTTTTPADQAILTTARPQTMTQMIGLNGHSDASVGDSIPGVVEFCRYLR